MAAHVYAFRYELYVTTHFHSSVRKIKYGTRVCLRSNMQTNMVIIVRHALAGKFLAHLSLSALSYNLIDISIYI